ncbi:hypothetical protein MRX96_031019 [Rhipicephalus microplus]
MVSSKSQNTYAAQFNKKAKAKEFNVGDLVLVFDDQRPGKMFPKWEGPGSVTERYREHSYFVQMPAARGAAAQYLERILHLIQTLEDPSELAIVAYALILVNSAEGNMAFNLLDEKSRETSMCMLLVLFKQAAYFCLYSL